MTEWLVILLPVAAASGWWAASRSYRRKKALSATGDVDPAYFRGLNYLVNEQPDKAIDVFVRMLEVNSETVELHLALGNLFRRRGESDRAIRIHQNLVARPGLSRKERAHALLELGHDYLRAGLLDRAENLFNELVEMDMLVRQALRHLIVIFQHERDWEKCLQASRKLESLGDLDQRKEQAHYYCELADEARRAGDLTATGNLVRQAQSVDPENPRPLMMQGDLAMHREDYGEALRIYRQVEAQHPAYTGEILDALATCHKELGKSDEWQQHLREQYARHPSLPLMLAVGEDLRRSLGPADARKFVSGHLQGHPSYRGLAFLLKLRREEQGEEVSDFLALVDSLTTRLTSDLSTYRCHRCGFSVRSLHWQCPGCRAWGTMKQTEEHQEKGGTE
jgi:lipopolysaccharide biosynthesis regulator YciM